jgi:hypothetical protein
MQQFLRPAVQLGWPSGAGTGAAGAALINDIK